MAPIQSKSRGRRRRIVSMKLGECTNAEHDTLKVEPQVSEGLKVWRQCNPRAGTGGGEICSSLFRRVGVSTPHVSLFRETG